jgi:hypothetical protein
MKIKKGPLRQVIDQQVINKVNDAYHVLASIAAGIGLKTFKYIEKRV